MSKKPSLTEQLKEVQRQLHETEKKHWVKKTIGEEVEQMQMQLWNGRCVKFIAAA
ncbi:hypothetical protein JAAARDRAFT_196413 [Jaapia argillacea MUCL 33604]|uniref:Uncharacterized protein n=1 Tax=Jaapia argillacea MUCL 33604 TaxID=933084 RepID=A0A067PT84_9AGAM|nr:hypothetical protein JAAARDRAFT_196413 [Jaapia argillacea MUCL 33604]